MKIGVYPGSFNPFHIGHHNIYLKSQDIFDKVFIAQGINPDKKTPMRLSLEGSLTIQYDTILTDCIEKIYQLNKGEILRSDIFIIRGFRNIDDIKFQSEQDYWLKQIDYKFQSIYIECDEDFKHISSSAIKTLKQLNQPYKHLIL